jgi:ABC-2 type transport system ATP-binding protein
MIRAQNVSKYYGAKRALGPVSFEIEDGETVGFLGLNGAGKTTALRIFACDLRPSGGSIQVGETDAVADPHEVRKQIGFLPENPPLYMDMTVAEYLDFAGRLRGMSGAEIRRRMPRVLEITDLGPVRGDVIGTLSHGYRQRVGVAQAIIHEPRLLILDEPTRGLDPVQIVEMRSLLGNLKQNHTVLISSHILTEISETCDRILVLGNGEIIGSGTEADLSKELVAAGGFEIAVRSRGDVPFRTTGLRELIAGVPGVTSCEKIGDEDGGEAYAVAAASDLRGEVARAVVQAGHDVVRLARTERELESIFLKLVQGGDRARN